MILKVIPGPAFSWESQAAQYGRTGEAGIRLERHAVNKKGQEVDPDCDEADMVIDCLLHREPDGSLSGILNHYQGNNPWEEEGNINIWVRPDCQRRGIATRLVVEAADRWPIRIEQQRYTQDGLELLAHLQRVAR